MKYRLLPALVLLIFSPVLFAANVVFFGLDTEQVPALGTRFSRQLRENLYSRREIELVDEATTQLLSKRLFFGNKPAVSRTLVNRMFEYVTDTTLLVWGSLDRLTIKPERSYLIRWRATGQLSLSLIIYSLAYKQYIYTGDIHASVDLPMGWIFFHPLTKTHIPARSHVDLINTLAREAALKTAHMVGTIHGAEQQRIELDENFGAKKLEEPTIRDLFQVPSMEGERVESDLLVPEEEPPPPSPDQEMEETP
jgi:hypothetical protein